MNLKGFFKRSNVVGNVVINGSVVGGNVVINGETINPKDLITKSFDERKTESVEEIDTIRINSSCPVKISSSDSMNAVAHFSGNATYSGEVEFNVEKLRNELIITVALKGFFKSTDLCLNVSISNLKKYKNIFVETTSSETVFMDSRICSENINLRTTSGSMTIRGNFNNIGIGSTSANIDLKTEYADSLSVNNTSGTANIVGNYKNIKIKATSGDFTIESNSAEKLNFDSSSGSLKLTGSFKDISISTKSGAVQINSKLNEYLKIDNTSSQVKLEGVFKNIRINSVSSRINSDIKAISDIKIDLKTTSGNANFDFENIKKVKISGGQVSGKVRNNHLEKENGYIANINYDVTFCNITIN